MAEAGVDARALSAGEDTDPRVRSKARTKVLKQGLYPRDLTDAMRQTPRDRLYERALRGRWHLFEISPEPFYDRLAHALGDGYRSKGQTFRLERRIEAARERLDRRTAKHPAARLAARRALVTWCYRAMERSDDSYGLIGEAAREALFTYAELPFEPAGIGAEEWCDDLCELLVWEDWGCSTATKLDRSRRSTGRSPITQNGSWSRSHMSCAPTACATRPTRRLRTSPIYTSPTGD
jgi:hypothetical protein